LKGLIHTVVLLFLALSATRSYSQQSKLSVESAYFQLIDEGYEQGQYKPIVDIGLRLLLSENKKHNFGFSVNANFSNSQFGNNQNFNTLQFRLISSLFPVDSSRFHPFYGLSLSSRSLIMGYFI